MKVQELLDSKDKWTQGTMAEDKNEQRIWYDSVDAVKWCLLGAIHRCYSSEANVVRKKIEEIANESIVFFNDTHSYDEVMKLVRKLDL